jgi:hypothetical protein
MAGFVTSWKIKLDGPIEIDGLALPSELPPELEEQPPRAARPAIALAVGAAFKSKMTHEVAIPFAPKNADEAATPEGEVKAGKGRPPSSADE